MATATARADAASRRNLLSPAAHVWTAWAALGGILLSTTETDPDLWGHVRFGLDWLHTRTLTALDPYSFTQDRPWINHEWLSEAAMAASYTVAGPQGLIALKALLIGASLLILAGRLRGSTPVVIASTLTVALFCVLPVSLTVRPQLWSALALCILMVLLDRPGAPGAARIAGGALLFGAWANLHGGWITGAPALVAYCGIAALRQPSGAARWAIFAACSLTATLATPYGIELWRFLGATVGPTRPDIGEWQPLASPSVPWTQWIPVLAPLGIAAALAVGPVRTRPRLEIWAVLLLFTVAGIRVLRVGPLVATASLVLLAPGIRDAWGSRGRLLLPRGAALVMAVPVAVAILAAVRPTVQAWQCIRIAADDPSSPDLETAGYFAGRTGRLWTSFNWGEYAIWHFGPRLRVSIDGRRETVYSDGVLELHRAFARGDEAARRTFLAFAPDYVWLPAADTAVRDWLERNGYRIDGESAGAFVAVRGNHPSTSGATAPGPCFP